MKVYKRICDPTEHAIHLCVLREMEEMLPMNDPERKSLRGWVYRGNDPEQNPWNYADRDGWPLNYLEAYRYHYGYKLVYQYKAIEE